MAGRTAQRKRRGPKYPENQYGWTDRMGVWRRYPTEEELRDIPEIKDAIPIWHGPIQGYLDMRRKQREQQKTSF